MTVAHTSLEGQRVLVTGAGGFLGRHVCRALKERGAHIHGLGRSQQPEGAEFRWIQADCAVEADVRAAFKQTSPDTVFHLAGHADGRRDVALVPATLRGNLLTTVNVLTAAGEAGCRRIVLAGSLEEPAVGEIDAIPSSPYAAAKWAATAYARMFHALYRTPVVVARIMMTYGPGQSRRKVIPYVVRCLLEGTTPELASAERLVDWIHVDDTTAGLLALATAEQIEGRVLDVGTGKLTTIRDVVERLSVIAGEGLPDVGLAPRRALEQVVSADVEETYRATGWGARISLDAGLARTFAHEFKHGRSIEPEEIR